MLSAEGSITNLSNEIIDAIRFLNSSSLQELSSQYPRIPLWWFKHKNCVIRQEVRDDESEKDQ